MSGMSYKNTIYILIFIIGLSFVLYPKVSKKQYEYNVEKIVAEFHKYSTGQIAPKEISNLEILSEDMIATVEVPKINLNLPVYYGTSVETLSDSIGLMENGTKKIGGDSTHSVLAGHSGLLSKELFTNIHKLDVGDDFYIQTNNDRFKYKVIDNRKIKVTETDYLKIQEDNDLVTLLTCPTFDSKRYRIIVTGERIKEM